MRAIVICEALTSKNVCVTQKHHWHIKTVLLRNACTIVNVAELRDLVEGNKRQYFNGQEFNRAYSYLRRVGAIRKVRKCLEWKQNTLTPANLDFLEGRSHKPCTK